MRPTRGVIDLYSEPFFNFNNIVTLLLIVAFVVVFVRLILRQSRVTQRNKETLRQNEETRKYNIEQVAMAQAKRDEQIRLMNELVELEKQSVENQKEILELLKRR